METDQQNTSQAKKSLEQLQQENSALQYDAEHDWLTGLYNHGAMKRLADEWLLARQTGALIAMDLDYFKQVNDRYGHITGDLILQKVAFILTRLFPNGSLIGRIGGDEFVVLLQAPTEEKEIDLLCNQLRRRMQEPHLNKGLKIHLDVTAAGTLYRQGDCYRSMFDRADQKIIQGKRLRKLGKKRMGPIKDLISGITTDMEIIASEIRERPAPPGCYCQDYETFKAIYRYAERKMRRSKDKAFLLLFTLTDSKGDFPALESRDAQMAVLGAVIHDGLRMGDVFTQYSSCQYLVMVSDLTLENADMLAKRICQTYQQEQGETSFHTVVYYSYPLQPTRVMEGT
ncbi:GGDEF domain-containing protein [Zongyangia hominis]|uniref:GGDEF domain-containing protein n=1 Tax=Zongyangia hominis TaxID=2763677 RepID=A0A926EAG1_9FIRM|nr:GGDEF domain-containing protein [Zongyangia hominis]MBC8570292.1 GGDEF domain-containing protein [Zongyangia hominis]